MYKCNVHALPKRLRPTSFTECHVRSLHIYVFLRYRNVTFKFKILSRTVLSQECQDCKLNEVTFSVCGLLELITVL